MNRISAILIVISSIAGCAVHREPPAPTYLPVMESSVQIVMNRVPKGSLIVGTVTIQQDTSHPIEQSYVEARRIAAGMGADVLYLRSQADRRFVNGDLHFKKTHIIAFTAVRTPSAR
jgi:hypothetical protein